MADGGHRARNRVSSRAYQIRVVRFGRTSRWRAGLDPGEVYGYLRGVADEVDELHRDLRMARDEVLRVRAALRQWQDGHAHCHRRGPANQGAWGRVR